MTKIPFLLCTTLTLTLLASMQIAEAAKKGAVSPGQSLPSTQIADLTAGECKRLGGFTEDSNRCRSGTTCITITRDHVEHSSCINEVE